MSDSDSEGLHTSSGSANGAQWCSFADIDFPSDSLSIKRLRTMFPEMFDEGDGLGDSGSYFFYPEDEKGDQPRHLLELDRLINDERTVAGYAFYNAIDPFPGETLREDDRDWAQKSRSDLEQLYQRFKLADSPESARVLIEHIEGQAMQQGVAVAQTARSGNRER